MEIATAGAVAIFFFLVGLESWISARRQLRLYEVPDTLNNLFLGAATFAFKFFTKVSILLMFEFFSRYALSDLGEGLLMWTLLFFGNDLMFYIFHRISHERRFFWAAHVVHHSSLKMNFTTSMRGNFIIMTYRLVFWLPLVFLGFDPLAIILMDSFAFLYQLWLHTELIGKLGPLEWFLNTPSHHRVHHGSNPKYLDKNYGAVLIIWDRMFGTFQKEDEKVEYGLTKNINTYNPIKVAFHEYVDIVKDLRKSRSLREAWQYLMGRPGWQPEEEEAEEEITPVKTTGKNSATGAHVT